MTPTDSINSQKMQELIRNLSSPDELDRIYAAEDLGATGSEDAVPPLFERLVIEPSLKVCETIFLALEQIKSRRIIEYAFIMLQERNAFLRNHALTLLQHKGTETLSVLHQKFLTSNEDMRKFIVDIASEIPSAETSQIFKLALKDEDINVVIATVEHIGRLHLKEFTNSLLELFNKADEPMLITTLLSTFGELEAAEALEAIHKKYPSIDKIQNWLLPECIKVIGKIGTVQDMDWLYKAFLLHKYKIIPQVLDSIENIQRRHGKFELKNEFWEELKGLMDVSLSDTEYFQLLRTVGGFSAPPEIGKWLFVQINSFNKMIRLGVIEGLKRWNDRYLLNQLKIRFSKEYDEEVKEAIWNALHQNGTIV